MCSFGEKWSILYILQELLELTKMLDTALHVERMRIDAISDRLRQLLNDARAELQRGQLDSERRQVEDRHRCAFSSYSMVNAIIESIIQQ